MIGRSAMISTSLCQRADILFSTMPIGFAAWCGHLCIRRCKA